MSVPVLSKTTTDVRDAFSSTSPPLKRIPSPAPMPEPTITAVGVARPSAHGQAMTRVAAPNMKAIVYPSESPEARTIVGVTYPEYMATAHSVQVSAAMMTTMGTK